MPLDVKITPDDLSDSELLATACAVLANLPDGVTRIRRVCAGKDAQGVSATLGLDSSGGENANAERIYQHLKS